VYHYAIQERFALIFRVLCVIFLYVSYRKHSKNTMKGLMGALLGAQMITAIQYLSDITTLVECICVPAFAICSGLLFVNHFIINSDHHANPKMIFMNQILVGLLFLADAVWLISWGVSLHSAVMWVTVVLDVIGSLGMTAIIVCVESRLDAYRLNREAAGWTEKMGYPEGYVHEYQKTDNQ